MDTASLVASNIEEGRTLLEQLSRDGFDITGAFWVKLKLEEDGPWFFVVSKNVDQKGATAAYRDVHESIRRIPASRMPWRSVSEFSELRIVGTNDPVAKEVLAFRDRFPDRNRFRGVSTGNHLLEELYIYPPLTKSGGENETSRSLTVELPVRIWEKLQELAARSAQAGTPAISAGKIAAEILEKSLVDTPC